MTDGWLYVVVRCDGKEVAVAESRHEAAGLVTRCRGCRSEWYTVEAIHAATILWWTPRMTDAFDPYPDTVPA